MFHLESYRNVSYHYLVFCHQPSKFLSSFLLTFSSQFQSPQYSPWLAKYLRILSITIFVCQKVSLVNSITTKFSKTTKSSATNPSWTRRTFTSVYFYYDMLLVSNEIIAPQSSHLEKRISFKLCLPLLSFHSSNLPLLLLHELQTAELNKKNCSNVKSTSLLL